MNNEKVNKYHKQLKLWHTEEDIQEEEKGVTEESARAFQKKGVAREIE